MDRNELIGRIVSCIQLNADDGVEHIKLDPDSEICIAEAIVCVLEDCGFMCQADDSAKGDAVSATPLQSNDNADAEVWFVTEFTDDEAVMCRPENLTDDGEPRHERHVLFVDINRVHAKQDGVFVQREIIDGEVHYRQCRQPDTEEIIDLPKGDT